MVAAQGPAGVGLAVFMDQATENIDTSNSAGVTSVVACFVRRPDLPKAGPVEPSRFGRAHRLCRLRPRLRRREVPPLNGVRLVRLNHLARCTPARETESTSAAERCYVAGCVGLPMSAVVGTASLGGGIPFDREIA